MTRRTLLSAAAVLGLAGCAAPATSSTTASRTTPSRASTSASPGAGAGAPPAARPPAGPDGTHLAADTSAPLTPLQHLMTVPVTLNGRGPYRFAIDSGSAATLHVSTKLARDLPQTGVIQQGDPAGQGTQAVPLVRVASLAIGAADFTGVEAAVGSALGSLDPDGIIGVGLFEELTATIDYPHRALRLTRTPLRTGPHTVAFTRELGTPRIGISAGGIALQADIDTGGPAPLTVPRSAGLPFTTAPAPAGTGHTTNGTFSIWAAPLNGNLTVAGWTTRHPAVDIVDALPGASLGAAFLRDYAVTFDLPASRLALTR